MSTGAEIDADTPQPVFYDFPDPSDDDFEEEIGEEEREYYQSKIKDINNIKNFKLHCTACDRHLGCSTKNDSKMRVHPMLKTLICSTCHTFYNSGEFDKGEDGSELYCRWCGQGGQVYCCADCPVVFCAKCVKRNFGNSKIKEIEDTDDWKCFKCNSKPLWDLRAVCWALLRYIDLKIKITHKTEDKELKDKYTRDGNTDFSDCCKDKRKRFSTGPKKKEDTKKADVTKSDVVAKLPPTIQVKKFASCIDDTPSKKAPQKQPQKRSLSPKSKVTYINKPIAISSFVPPINMNNSSQPTAKRSKLSINPMYNLEGRNPIAPRPILQYVPKKPLYIPRNIIPRMPYNGYQPPLPSDHINLSLESLTQGLDFGAMNTNMVDDSALVCTPDFPMEPLCQIDEKDDDDVQCITPGPVAPPISIGSAQKGKKAPLDTDNIIQMTDKDVTVNALTGGLKFRVDPQTLSANKMYRLPDGRVFAINANSKMPGGYSATIVSLADNTKKQNVRSETYSAKVSAVAPKKSPNILKKALQTSKVTPSRTSTSLKKSKNSNPKRNCDMKVPIEWYMYNMADAIDSLEYTLSKLKKIKKETNSMYLRSRTPEEMGKLYKHLDRLLNNSSTRFYDIRSSLTKEYKKYVQLKSGNGKGSDTDSNQDTDDDDVEILPDNDEPIFIDENSVDSINAATDDQVDALSDCNDTAHTNQSRAKSIESDKESNLNEVNSTNAEPHSDSNNSQIKDKAVEDSLESNMNEVNSTNDDNDCVTSIVEDSIDSTNDGENAQSLPTKNKDDDQDKEASPKVNEDNTSEVQNSEANNSNTIENTSEEKMDVNESFEKDSNEGEADKKIPDDDNVDTLNVKNNGVASEGDPLNDDKDSQDNIERLDAEMTDDVIEDLLKTDVDDEDLVSKVQCIVDIDPDLI